MGKKIKVERCCICNRIVDANDKSIKVKEKILYEDKDGIWYNFKNTYVYGISQIRFDF